ncbi:MAG: VWA domain-containing protein [Candidatus Euphemobacter frigidus]|nr:VWA domain-containing protein [Candidatus Euphemobacter frigidus]MDP8276337.1 VWA domain-containing protein [Candidatus Euphemobacter frigidus]
MRFGALNLIWLFLLLPILAILFRCAWLRKRQAENLFADRPLWERLRIGVSDFKVSARPVLILAVTALLLFSLLQPRWGYHWEDVTRLGIDLIVAVDTSRSMLADDVKPNRLALARREIEDLAHLLKGDRIGLIAFSGSAFTLCPLTLDYGAFRMFVNDLSVTTIPRGGTDISAAILKAIEAFGEGPGKHKALLIISDGENLAGDYQAAAEEAKKKGVKIFTIGIGSPEGIPIKLTTPEGTSYLKDREGNIVVSKLDEAVLQKIAVETGGAYHRATTSGLELELIYRDRIARMDKKELESTRKKVYEHRFQWPLAVALLLLVLESIMGERKWKGLRWWFLLREKE